ncbi:hypothetical protein K438DRAFT_1749755 [Mycena galopus ATCC 62051]|nr:hypothetical protein K438DRAFT_1749755 [Mycena galopus ATCC 62051]
MTPGLRQSPPPSGKTVWELVARTVYLATAVFFILNITAMGRVESGLNIKCSIGRNSEWEKEAYGTAEERWFTYIRAERWSEVENGVLWITQTIEDGLQGSVVHIPA